MTLEKLEQIKKANWKICKIKNNEIGVDELGLPLYEIEYIDPPINYQLVRVIEPLGVAILEDKDYATTN